MADDKKKFDDKKKPAGGSGLFHKDHHKEVFWLLGALFIISFILQRIFVYFDGLEYSALGSFWQAVVDWFKWFWPVWKWIAGAHIVGGAIWSAYSYRKLSAIRDEEAKIYNPEPEGVVTTSGQIDRTDENKKWLRVQELVNSKNPTDWRLAIIEADVMLEDLLRASGYDGDGVADLLKAVDPSDMLTLDAAWEGHKVRNRIAHSGEKFDLNEREANRVIGLFESVFREFDII